MNCNAKFDRRFFLIAASSFTASTLFASCTNQPDQATEQSDLSQPLRVGVTPVPAGEILAFVRDNLAKQAGLTIQITEFNDFNQPNLALKDGAIDANYFQHIPFMTDFGKQHNIDLVALNAVHFNPVGIYSKKIRSIDQVSNNASVTIPNDVTNANRALKLLAAQGLIKLREGVGDLATSKDIATNSKSLRITEIEAPSLIRSLDDAQISVITGNFVVQAGMNPKRDALALESATNTPYAVRLATLKGKENDPRIQLLNKLLVDPKVRDFINQKYQGAVVAVF